MHPPEDKARALELVAQGINDCEIARRLGIPRPTIRDWRRPTYRRRTPLELCPRCWRASPPMRFTDDDYAELLAMYLGDGCISTHPRTSRLRLALDAKYPAIVSDTRTLLERCFPANAVGQVIRRGESMVTVSLYSSHLPCLFPQHGPGLKHQRPIRLEGWQRTIVDAAPWPLVRGFIRTDGCAFVNRTGRYEYLSYQFTNMSHDIVALFVKACDQVGVFTRVNCSSRGLWDVRINRRPSVALMREHVGLKK